MLGLSQPFVSGKVMVDDDVLVEGGGSRIGVRIVEAWAMYCFGLSSGDGAGLEEGQVSM